MFEISAQDLEETYVSPKQGGPVRRQEFCPWVIDKLCEDENFFCYVIFTDEAKFHRNGFVNRHNFHYATKNPHHIQQTQSQFC